MNDVSGNEKATVVGRFQIEMLSDGSVNVNGPIKNPVIVLDCFGKALSAVADYVIRQAIEDKQASNMSKPSIILPS